MPVSTAQKTKFWIVCCEDNAVTQQLTQAITHWQLPGVRAYLSRSLSPMATAAIAQADHAIFITQNPHPCSQLTITPLMPDPANDALAQPPQPPTEAPFSPAKLLTAMQSHTDSLPQAWWFQLPNTDVRAQQRQAIAPAPVLSQTLNQIEIFIRNYTLQTSYLQNMMEQAAAKQPQRQVAA